MLSVSAAYTVTATNTGGSDTAAVTIVVNDEVPTIAYSPENLTLTKNQTSTDFATDCNGHGFGDDHVLGHQPSFAKRLILWNEQWNDLGNANIIDDAQDVHNFGEQ